MKLMEAPVMAFERGVRSKMHLLFGSAPRSRSQLDTCTSSVEKATLYLSAVESGCSRSDNYLNTNGSSVPSGLVGSHPSWMNSSSISNALARTASSAGKLSPWISCSSKNRVISTLLNLTASDKQPRNCKGIVCGPSRYEVTCLMTSFRS